MIARISKVGGLVKVFAILFEYLSNNLVNNADFEELSDELVANGDFEEIGPELITNGDFEDGSTSWDINPNSGTAIVSGGKLNFTNCSSSGTNIQQKYTGYVVGKTYKVTYTVTDFVQGYVRVSVGNQITTPSVTNGTFTEYIKYATGLPRTYVYTGNSTLSLDNVSVKEVDPNDEWKSSNDATISGGKGHLDSASSTALLWQVILTDTKTYKVTLTVSNYNGVGQNRVINNSGGSLYTITSNGTFTFTFTHSIASGNFLLQSKNGGSFSVDNVSVKQVDPNDSWVNEGVWTIQDGVASGNGANGSAEELKQNGTVTAGKTYRFSYEIKNYVSGGFGLYNDIVDSGGFVSANGVYTGTFVASINQIRLRGNAFFNGDVTNISVQEVQEEDLNTDTTYISPKDLSLKFKAGEAQVSSEFLEKTISIPVENVQDDAGDSVGDETAIANYIDSLT